MNPLILWSISIFCFLQGLRILSREFGAGERIFRLSRERAELKRVSALFTELEETLCAGLALDLSRLSALRELPAPWGSLAYDSLQELRSRGGALLPTLRRLRALSEEHSAALADSRAKSAQSLAQAAACSVLAPALGGVLAWLLPGVREHLLGWTAACALAFSATGMGALWMLGQAENARWGGLARERRAWVLAALCGGERFLALVRAGTPADTAWARACELLAREAPGLAELWGHSVWAEQEEPTGASPKNAAVGATASLADAGKSIRKAVQVSLMEGRPCAERVESALQALRVEIKAWVDRELALLGTRSLKPLFLCVAPALLGLMAFGLYLGAGAMLFDT